MTTDSSLSSRGVDLDARSMRALFTAILQNPYDPQTNPTGFVNMGIAENYAMIPDVAAFANSHLDLSEIDFTYGEGAWGTARLRTAMAVHMAHYFPSVRPIDPKDIIVTSGVTSACDMLGFALCDPGDAILFSRPVYGAFESDFSLKAQVRSLFVGFDSTDPFGPACVANYERALQQAKAAGTRVRAIMLCNPHNPLGICYPKETIIALMRLCQQHRIHLLADEIYATSVYAVPGDDAANPFTSVLSFDTAPYIDNALLHVIYGMSKDFAAGGLRLGIVYSRNAQLVSALSAIVQFSWVSLPSQTLAANMLEDRAWMDAFVAKSRRTLAERNVLCRRMLDDKGITYRPGSNAGFFLWLDLTPWLRLFAEKADSVLDEKQAWAAEAAMAEAFVAAGLYATDGKSMHAETPGQFRLVFSQHEAAVHEGLRRMFAVLGI